MKDSVENGKVAVSPLNVLFLCPRNEARSILAEALLNSIGPGRFRAFSAGRVPNTDGRPHLLTMESLREAHADVEGLRSKSVEDLLSDGAPGMDLVISLCDKAAGEVCPTSPLHPVNARWRLPDPSSVPGTEERREAFRQTMHRVRRGLQLLVALPADAVQDLMGRDALAETGSGGGARPPRTHRCCPDLGLGA